MSSSIIVVFPKIEEAKAIKNLLIKSGYNVNAVCSTGAQAVSQLDELNDGIIICGYKMKDMIYTEIRDYLPEGFEMLLVASTNILSGREESNIMSLAVPFKVNDFVNTVNMMLQAIERRRRKRRLSPKDRKPEEMAMITKAKNLLIERNGMTEEEAYRYIQKCSMDSSTNMVETAQMVLSIMKE